VCARLEIKGNFSNIFYVCALIKKNENDYNTEKKGLNGANEHFVDPQKTSTKAGFNNIHYSINELIVNTNRSANNEVIKGNMKRYKRT
jgi:hypothetical protein